MKRYFRDLYDVLVNQNYGSKNTHLVEIFLSLGAFIGIGLAAVMLRAGW
ncbi:MULTISPECIES: hypothetical protein [Methanothrix]|jgi:hypothetical protein|uniref:Uncharacterized protein n=3 Tax=root TaxID=1 RepID=F4BV46_METSG|nr:MULTISPECIES: hypothetical protein [Methanothrix]NYT10308.1 hypothetical protein [Methanosarcinales archaeon]OPX80701.1 MAG: hypothetical protein A4E43_00860 [Methanosaeta sp. PtaB.Bin005]AEB67114.1 hypothetical protein MCON_0217 [Methanothrix soehngenii GP6]MBP7068300.1 hypothetical protein [Methanothrix sp.]MCK9406826.1 hypothetical protein [Methanothrix sp.]